MNRVTDSYELWKYCYERDFESVMPSSSSLSPQHLYYIRSISGFMCIDRMKTMNNMK